MATARPPAFFPKPPLENAKYFSCRTGVIRAKDLRSGDVLVVKLEHSPSEKELADIRQVLGEVFPNNLVCIMPRGTELSRVRFA